MAHILQVACIAAGLGYARYKCVFCSGLGLSAFRQEFVTTSDEELGCWSQEVTA